MSTIEDVRQALEAVLTGPLGIASKDIAWAATPFDPTKRTTRWYRPTFIPGEPRAAATGSDAPNRFVFIFQIDIFDPTGKGETFTETEAQRIASQFKRGTAFVRNGQTVMCDKSYRGNVYVDSGWVNVPVIVKGWADVPN